MPDNTPLFNPDAINGGAISTATRRVLAIFLGILAGFMALVVTRIFISGAATEGSLLAGVLSGVGVLSVWWCVRSDQRAARASGNPLLVTSRTASDILVTAAAFGGGAIAAGILFGANVGAVVAAGLATITALWVGQYIWTGTIQFESDTPNTPAP